MLKYECAIFPPALFESPGVLLEPQKAQLANALWAYRSMKQPSIPKNAKYVIDGGALFHGQEVLHF